jgi:serine/threonine-protein kinase
MTEERETSAIVRRALLPFQPGDLLAGRYRIGDVLGMGGMGVVYAATRVATNDPVALKVLLPESLADEELVTRFAREARAVARIRSAHIARVLDVGTLDEGGPFIVLERLEGSDLGARLAQSGPLAPEEAVSWVLETCDAVAEAHSLGIVHRDLKPDNIFLAKQPDGRVIAKLLDFGISKVEPGLAAASLVSGPSVTKSSTVMGSPMYMSPEQLRGFRDVDARSDIWSLGVTLYQLLTGEGPFVWTTVPELCAAVLKEEPRPPRSLRPSLDPRLEAAVLRCLERSRDARFSSVGELAAALAPHARPPARAMLSQIAEKLGLDAAALAIDDVCEAESTSVVMATRRLPPILDPSLAAPPSVRARSATRWPAAAIVTALLLLGGGALVAMTSVEDAPIRATTAPAESVARAADAVLAGVRTPSPSPPASVTAEASAAPAPPPSASLAHRADPKAHPSHTRDVFADRK